MKLFYSNGIIHWLIFLQIVVFATYRKAKSQIFQVFNFKYYLYLWNCGDIKIVLLLSGQSYFYMN